MNEDLLKSIVQVFEGLDGMSVLEWLVEKQRDTLSLFRSASGETLMLHQGRYQAITEIIEAIKGARGTLLEKYNTSGVPNA